VAVFGDVGRGVAEGGQDFAQSGVFPMQRNK
jgi:hypothetical protein